MRGFCKAILPWAEFACQKHPQSNHIESELHLCIRVTRCLIEMRIYESKEKDVEVPALDLLTFLFGKELFYTCSIALIVS